MFNSRTHLLVLVAAASFALSGCGGSGDDSDAKKKSGVSPNARIARCLDKQPEATQDECKEWEDEGQLKDDGTHRDHENMEKM